MKVRPYNLHISEDISQELYLDNESTAMNNEVLGPHVPLRPFLPGAPWESIREFLYEAFADMHRLHVQDVLLRPNALFDASILSSPTQLQKALPSHNRLTVNSNPFMGVMQCTNSLLLVPAYSIDELGIGVGVESCGGDGPPDPYIPTKERVLHYIVNNRTGTLITLASCGKVYEFGYQKLSENGSNVTSCMLFDSKLFVNAFEGGHLRFDTLERALLRASHCTSELSNACSNAVLRDISYPYRVTHVRGEYRMRTMVSAFRDTVQLNAMPLAADCDVMRALNGDDFNHMKSWALTALFSQVAPVPQFSLLPCDSNQTTTTSKDCNPLALLLHGDQDSFIRLWQQQHSSDFVDDDVLQQQQFLHPIDDDAHEEYRHFLHPIDNDVEEQTQQHASHRRDDDVQRQHSPNLIDNDIHEEEEQQLSLYPFDDNLKELHHSNPIDNDVDEQTQQHSSNPIDNDVDEQTQQHSSHLINNGIQHQHSSNHVDNTVQQNQQYSSHLIDTDEEQPNIAQNIDPAVMPNPAPRAIPAASRSAMTARARPVQFARPPHIAPAPGVAPATGPARTSAMQALTQRRLTRQIRKREAAARSHAKRKAARTAQAVNHGPS